MNLAVSGWSCTGVGFPDEREEMAAVGMGAVFHTASDSHRRGAAARRRDR
ncbi:hypothetical protein GCM10017687_77620 [Streptomyces echinatus]